MVKTEYIRVINILLILNPAATDRKMNSIPGETRTDAKMDEEGATHHTYSSMSGDQ